MKTLYRTLCTLLCCALLAAGAGCQPKGAQSLPSPSPFVPAPSAEPVSQAPELPAAAVDFQEFAEELNRARKEAAESRRRAPDLTPYLYDEGEPLITEEEAELLLEKREAKTVSAEEAREDVDLLFRTLKSCYAPYFYFGGDEAFLPVRDAVLEELETLPELPPAALEELLSRHLTPLIRDGHFRIGSTFLIEAHSQAMYYVPDLYFRQKDGLDESLVKPTIGPEGELTYCLAALSHDGKELPAFLERNGRETALTWRRVENEAHMGGPAFLEEERDGIPLLTSRRMYAENNDPEQLAQLERFASCGEDYQFAPLLLLDLRGNTGGNSMYASQFLARYRLCSENVACTSNGFKLSPLFRKRMQLAGNENDFGEKPWKTFSTNGYWVDSGLTKRTFVLMDRASASSAEYLLHTLRSCADTVFVGSNSLGAFVSDSVAIYLPHSGLPLCTGDSLQLHNSGENIDGTGFLPDLWVDPDDALDAVLRLIRYYGLADS